MHDEKAARRDAELEGTRQIQALQFELATLRERTAAAEQRATDLAPRCSTSRRTRSARSCNSRKARR